MYMYLQVELYLRGPSMAINQPDHSIYPIRRLLETVNIPSNSQSMQDKVKTLRVENQREGRVV